MSDLSEYELLRQKNIARNMEVMRQLGLDASDFTAHRNHGNDKGNTSNDKSTTEKKKAPVKKRKFEAEEKGVERRSSRILGNSSDLQMLDGDDTDGTVIQPQQPRHHADLKGSAIDHELAEAEHLRWAGRQGKVTIVGTASYKHTLMRVRTMSEARLITRIKVIERASGQHAVVKMRLFARVLCLEGYEELAFDAADALTRLIVKLGDPEYGPPEEAEEEAPKSCERIQQEMMEEAIRRSKEDMKAFGMKAEDIKVTESAEAERSSSKHTVKQ